MEPEYIDIHAHMQDAAYDADRDDVIARMRGARVAGIIVGTDMDTSKDAVALARAHNHLYATVGIHPTDKPSEQFNKEAFEALARAEKVVGIGECGLDYYRGNGESAEERVRQKEMFERQLDVAVAEDLPLMIHCRNAHEDTLDILSAKKREYGDKLKGNIHFFTADTETAKRYLELGFTLSFPGVITFASDYDEAVRYAPLDAIMAETDSPYAAPVPHRGKRNEPVFVSEVAARIAELRGGDLETVKKALVANARRVFRLP